MEDAIRVAELLQNRNIEVVYTSPYKRAVQTVQAVAEDLGVSIILEEDFKERKLAENPVEDFKQAIRKVWQDYDFHFKSGESNHMAQERGVNTLLKVLKQLKGKNIVIGTHGNIMVLMMNYFDASYGFEFWQNLGMPDIYMLSFEEDRLIDVKRIWE